MKNNKELILITSDTLVSKLKKEYKESNITFLFPITGFTVGIPYTFKLEEINEEGFIYINRLLDKKGIIDFKKLLKKIPSNIKGIVFEDIGILNVLMETKSNLFKILYLSHMNCNYKSVNAFLEYVDSLVISTDITSDETKEILIKSKKPLVVFSFGYVPIMYSRRTLLTNYNKHFKREVKNAVILKETMSNHKLKLWENEFGTVLYPELPFNNLALRQEDNILYNYINTTFMSDEEILEVLNSKNNLEDIYPYKYLSEEETIFKIKEERV